MNNCVKCGNPLQPGVTSCPICGTVAQPNNENLTDSVGVGAAQSAPPVQSASIEQLNEPAVAAPAAVDAPAPTPAPAASTPAAPAPTPAPAASTPAAPAPTPAAPASAAPVPASEPVPAVQNQTAPVSDANGFSIPAAPAPEAAAPQPAQAADFSASQPTQTFQSTGSPSVGDINPMNPEVTFNQPAQQPVPQQVTIENVTKKEKRSILPTILIAVFALVAGGAGGYFLNIATNKQEPVIQQVEASSLEARSNGFTFDIEKDWIYNQYGDKVIVNNKDESLTMRIGKSSGNFNDINLTNIETSLFNKTGYSDVKVEKTKIDDVDVIFVDCKNEELFIQYYYLASDSSTVITTVVIYEQEDTKKADEEKIRNIVKTLKYTDEAVKAIGSVNMYASKFDDATYTFFDSLVPVQNDNIQTEPENEQVVE